MHLVRSELPLNLLNGTPSFGSWDSREWLFLVEISLIICHVRLPYVMGFDIKMSHQRG